MDIQPLLPVGRYPLSSPFQTVPPLAPPQERSMAGPLYGFFFGVRKGLIKNPRLSGPAARPIGALGVAAEVMRMAEGKFNTGDDVAILARGLNSSGIIQAVFRNRAPQVGKALEGIATVADLEQSVYNLRPEVIRGRVREFGDMARTFRDPKAGVKGRFEAARRPIVGLANDISNLDTLFASVSAVATTMPSNVLGRAMGKLAGQAAFQKTNNLVKRILPVANWILFADSTVDLIRVNSDPHATLREKLGADALWLLYGMGVIGGVPAKITNGIAGAYSAVKLTQAVVGLADDARKQRSSPSPIAVGTFFEVDRLTSSSTGRYHQTIVESFGGGKG